MTSTKNPGRFAGLLYVLMSIPGVFALIYVPSKLIVHGNATATATNIAASAGLQTDPTMKFAGHPLCEASLPPNSRVPPPQRTLRRGRAEQS
jgi:hypothetical protein